MWNKPAYIDELDREFKIRYKKGRAQTIENITAIQ
jgi:hypothetical protein